VHTRRSFDAYILAVTIAATHVHLPVLQLLYICYTFLHEHLEQGISLALHQMPHCRHAPMHHTTLFLALLHARTRTLSL